MKKSIYVITTLTFLSVFVTQACDRASNDLEEAETTIIEADRDSEIAQGEIEAEVRIYRQEIAEDIKENNVAIAEIKEEIQDEDAETRAAYEVRIADLESTNRDLKRQIDNFGITNRDNWDDFKDQFSNDMDDLGNSLADFFSRTSTSIN